MSNVIQLQKNKLKTFNETQLSTMRKQFAKIDRIDDEHWGRIQYLLNDCDSREAICQLARSNIKFLSGIAQYYLDRGVLKRP